MPKIPTYDVRTSYLFSDVLMSFNPNKIIFTKCCLPQWISKFPGQSVLILTRHHNICPNVFSQVGCTLFCWYCRVFVTHISLVIWSIFYYSEYPIKLCVYMKILGRYCSLHSQIFVYICWFNELLGTFSWLSLLHKLKSTVECCLMRPWRKDGLGDIDFITASINSHTAVGLHMATGWSSM